MFCLYSSLWGLWTWPLVSQPRRWRKRKVWGWWRREETRGECLALARKLKQHQVNDDGGVTCGDDDRDDYKLDTARYAGQHPSLMASQFMSALGRSILWVERGHLDMHCSLLAMCPYLCQKSQFKEWQDKRDGQA